MVVRLIIDSEVYEEERKEVERAILATRINSFLSTLFSYLDNI